jgi:hypothetical protein
MGDGKALTGEERAALNTGIALVQGLDNPIRGTDWDKILDLAHRAVCYGIEGVPPFDESHREALKRLMRDVNAYRLLDNTLRENGEACRCTPCVQGRVARTLRTN